MGFESVVMMSFTLDEIKPFFLEPKLEDRKIATILEKIKVMYTIDRKGLPSKKWTRTEVSAYSAFYLTTNVAKLTWLFDQLPRELKEELRHCDIIDFGTGPGTYLLAFLRYFEGEVTGDLMGVDKEELMLEQAQKLTRGLYPKASLEFFQHIPPPHNDQNKRLLIFGNSLNELSDHEVIGIIERASADYILFIEPGTPVVYDQMMKIRDHFKTTKGQVLFPCPSLDLACPVKVRLEKEDKYKDDWCHQVWRGTHDQSIERLGQLAKIDRKVMPMITHLYASNKERVLDDSYTKARFIRFLNESKHAFLWEVCLLENSEQKICQFEIPKKTMSKKEAKEFKKLSVGASFDYEQLKEINDHHYRVKVNILS
tara:strand:+ start:75438 stop:76544 length:1107 start_codon:yes stop_codon:yes gene_type:complete